MDLFLCVTFCAIVTALTCYLSILPRAIDFLGYKKGSPLFQGIRLPLLFLVSATAQYATIKCPVPDTASPSHGYSRSMAYARAGKHLKFESNFVQLTKFEKLSVFH